MSSRSLLARCVPKKYLRASYRPRVGFAHRRNESTTSALQSTLKARRLLLVHDYLSPTPYHLLNVSLASFLPPVLSGEQATPLALPATHPSQLMPPGYHLIYFPPQVPESLLLPDGTDPLQSPGAPWVRRMWAGGSVTWNFDPTHSLRLDGQRAACVESILDMVVKGTGEAEKVSVTIERRMGHVEENIPEEDIRHDLAGKEAAVVEKRNLVFMREKTSGQAALAAVTPGKILKPPNEPTFSHTLYPSPALLFRFSALTFNAHKIHLDTNYCRAIEGHRNPLVHGPLQLFLIIQLLLRKAPGVCDVDDISLKEIEYRNLSPLYAEEPLKLCGRETGTRGVYDLWAETPEGGYAMKATARVGKPRH